MLQVARLAPKQLGESRDLVAAFLRGRLNPDGGFQDRAGASDLYYTVFGLDALIALQDDLPAEPDRGLPAPIRRRRRSRLRPPSPAWPARWAALRRPPTRRRRWHVLARIEAFRSDDGGYATTPGAPHGSAYAAFLALGAYQDLGRAVPARRMASWHRSRRLRAADGGYAQSSRAAIRADDRQRPRPSW